MTTVLERPTLTSATAKARGPVGAAFVWSIAVHVAAAAWVVGPGKQASMSATDPVLPQPLRISIEQLRIPRLPSAQTREDKPPAPAKIEQHSHPHPHPKPDVAVPRKVKPPPSLAPVTPIATPVARNTAPASASPVVHTDTPTTRSLPVANPERIETAEPAAARAAIASPNPPAPLGSSLNLADSSNAASQSAPAAPPAPPMQLATRDPSGGERIEPPHFNLAYLNNPKPDYPAIARRMGLEGTVIVRAFVDAGGRVEQADVRQSSGAPTLDDAALGAVRGWKFSPARRGDIAVAHWADVPIRFRLDH